MKVYGIDFTSRPSRRKPITCIKCELAGCSLKAIGVEKLCSFGEFEKILQTDGPWVAGLDFPFGLPRRFIKNMSWPLSWADYIDDKVKPLDRMDWRKKLDDYRRQRSYGDKEHRRDTDIAAGSVSPQKLYGVPVGLMFFEGAPRLRDSNAFIPGLQEEGDPKRVVVEAYPGVAARSLIGRRGYKNDQKSKQTDEQADARRDILNSLKNCTVKELYGFKVEADNQLSGCLIEDPMGDQLDALSCAVQAAWAWLNRENNYGSPAPIDGTEGWIADPSCLRRFQMRV